MFEEGKFLVFEEGQSLCSKKDIPCVRTKTFLVFEDDETPIFGRTDLRKGVSEAKFDVEADFDVEKSKIGPKSAENHEKPGKFCEKISEKKILASKNRKLQIVRNAFSQSFAAIGAKFEGERNFDVAPVDAESKVENKWPVAKSREQADKSVLAAPAAASVLNLFLFPLFC